MGIYDTDSVWSRHRANVRAQKDLDFATRALDREVCSRIAKLSQACEGALSDLEGGALSRYEWVAETPSFFEVRISYIKDRGVGFTVAGHTKLHHIDWCDYDMDGDELATKVRDSVEPSNNAARRRRRSQLEQAVNDAAEELKRLMQEWDEVK